MGGIRAHPAVGHLLPAKDGEKAIHGRDSRLARLPWPRIADQKILAMALKLFALRLRLSLERRAGVLIGRRVKVGACRPRLRVALTRWRIMTQSRQAKESLSSQAEIMSCATPASRAAGKGRAQARTLDPGAAHDFRLGVQTMARNRRRRLRMDFRQHRPHALRAARQLSGSAESWCRTRIDGWSREFRRLV